MRKKRAKRYQNMSSRSYNMAMIKSKNTKPEILLRKELWRRGLRYRKNCKLIYGKPDLVFLRKQIAIFIDGEFWHGYNFEEIKNRLKSNKEFWLEKIERNMERDFEITQFLVEQGWAVLRFWDFEIKNDLSRCADKIEHTVKIREIA